MHPVGEAPILDGLGDPAQRSVLDFGLLGQNCARDGIDPASPEQRQRLNEEILRARKVRYLIGRYGEDHGCVLDGSAFDAEARTVHMGVDLFCAGLEPVFAPAAGRVVLADREPGRRSFGNYVVVEHDGWYSFFGHLGPEKPTAADVRPGKRIGWVGDYAPRADGTRENGGWSRHLHYQVLTVNPHTLRGPDGVFRIGYSTEADFERNKQLFPDPSPVIGFPCGMPR